MKFKCRLCGACCRVKNGIVRVSDDEIRKIAGHLGKSEDDVIASLTDIAPDRQGLMLKSRPDGSCIFLTDDNLCEINPVKPAKCGSFPFEWTNHDSALVCPAIRELPTFAVVGLNGYSNTHIAYLKGLVEQAEARMSGVVILPHERTADNTRWFRNRHIPIFDSLESLLADNTPDVVFQPRSFDSSVAEMAKLAMR